MGIFSKIAQFVREAKIELRKVNWPTKQQTINYTLLVVAMSVAVAIFLGGLDLGFSRMLQVLIG